MTFEERVEALNLLKRLVDYREEYFSNDCLNSEGRKIAERAFALLLNADPSLKRRVVRIRRRPCFEYVRRLYEDLAECFEH